MPAARGQVTEPKQERSAATRRRLLDAAVDELVERGYAKLTTAGVARRAGVSRGAQQHHFPSKAMLVAEAIRHLAARQLDELREASARQPAGRARVERVLDVISRQYSGPLFAAVLELILAARADDDLRASIAPAAREIDRALHEGAADAYGKRSPADRGSTIGSGTPSVPCAVWRCSASSAIRNGRSTGSGASREPSSCGC